MQLDEPEKVKFMANCISKLLIRRQVRGAQQGGGIGVCVRVFY